MSIVDTRTVLWLELDRWAVCSPITLGTTDNVMQPASGGARLLLLHLAGRIVDTFFLTDLLGKNSAVELEVRNKFFCTKIPLTSFYD